MNHLSRAPSTSVSPIRGLAWLAAALLAAGCASLPPAPVAANADAKEAAAGPGAASTAPAPTSPTTGAATPVTGPGARIAFPALRDPTEPKKYDEVVTKEAKTQEGLFKVHRVKERVFFEIPAKLMGRDLLWSVEMSQASEGAGFSGMGLGYKVVRFERRDNRVFMRTVSFLRRGDQSIKAAIEANDIAPIVFAFQVEAENKDKEPVIEVSRLFLSNSPDLIDNRLATFVGAAGAQFVDASRSYVSEIKTFVENIETRATLTFTSTPPVAVAPQPGVPAAPTPRVKSLTAVVHYSLALLPEMPMMGRYFDQRVGYFVEPFQDFAANENRVVERQFIARFRLEKKNPDEAVSEPKQPIVFYITREVPEKWRKHMKQGVEDLQSAFEKAGFKNAILAKDAPTAEEDPNWDPEDARYNVIRWAALPVANAIGPHVHDPRSGEVRSAHIVFWHDILRIMEAAYYTLAGGADARVTALPLPDEVMGDALRYVTAHEVGHTLGLRHNHRASTAYTVAQLRDAAFVAKNGTTASIMSYGRFNSVAQPSDNVTTFIPRLGPYDFFAIEWGYKPLSKPTPEHEKAELDRMAAEQVGQPWLQFGGEDSIALFDPTVLTENIGKERVEATRLSLANLERGAARLLDATTRTGEDYSQLEGVYNFMLRQRQSFLSSVVKMIGGVQETRFLGGRGGDTFTRVSKEEQTKALRFLLDEGLATDTKLLDPRLINRIRFFNVASPVTNVQKSVLAEMLLPIRFKLLEDAEMMAPGSGMLAPDFLLEVQRGVFRELGTRAPVVDVYRRDLQNYYVDQLKAFAGERQRITTFAGLVGYTTAPVSIDLQPAALTAVNTLKRDVQTALPRTKDRATQLHLTNVLREIDLILKPPKA